MPILEKSKGGWFILARHESACHPCSGPCKSSLYRSSFSICAAEASTRLSRWKTGIQSKCPWDGLGKQWFWVAFQTCFNHNSSVLSLWKDWNLDRNYSEEEGDSQCTCHCRQCHQQVVWALALWLREEGAMNKACSIASGLVFSYSHPIPPTAASWSGKLSSQIQDTLVLWAPEEYMTFPGTVLGTTIPSLPCISENSLPDHKESAGRKRFCMEQRWQLLWHLCIPPATPQPFWRMRGNLCHHQQWHAQQYTVNAADSSSR